MEGKLLKHGAFGWFELMTKDVTAAKKFYGELLGWKMRDDHMEGFTYTVIDVNGDEVAGMMSMPPESGDMPPAWGIYFTVDDIKATVAQAKEMGGTVLVEPRHIPEVGQFAVIQDPQGAWFSVMEYPKE